MVKLFIESGIDTYACGNALQLASSKSYIDIVKLLVESGVDIHFNNDSALRYTTNVDIMKFLIESGADIYSNNNDYYIITIAITKNNLNVIKFLVEIGIDINVDNYALITAISMANTDIINYLIEADTYISDEQRLQIACGFGHLDTVISLVEQGVNIYANYIYLLRVASQNGHLNVINFFNLRNSLAYTNNYFHNSY